MKYIFLFFLFIQTLSFSAVSAAQESLFDSSALTSLFNKEPEFLPVEEAFTLDFYQQGDQVEIQVHIEPGYYLYRKQFKFTSDEVNFEPVELPKGIWHEDEFFGRQQIYKESFSFSIKLLSIENSQSDNAEISMRYQGCAEKGLCYPPNTQVFPVSEFSSENDNQAVLNALSISSANKDIQAENSLNSSATASVGEQFELADMLANNNILITLVAFFLGGLLLAFTPCVFPMYPILTGIIVGQSEQLTTGKAFRLSFAYVQGMAVTYTLLGVVVALAGAQFQAMFQHPVVLVTLSLLFIVLALSMFGVFNLALPQSWQQKLTNLSNQQKGGSYWGVLAMGAISGLVASPCTTAPLTGALLYISHSGDVLLGAAALYALSLGMGLPLLVLGSSGGKLLPKAGSWMTVIKNCFGLLLLAVPVFLLERFLPENVISLLWSALILATGGYFYALNQEKVSTSFGYIIRTLLIFCVLFLGLQKGYQTLFPPQNIDTAKQEHHFTYVNNLAELQLAVKQANQENKKVMLDLYADWCIACKEFEKYTFSDPIVKQALSNYVWLQIDLTDTSSPESIELMEHFQVFGLPSILFFNENGAELTQKRVTGFMHAKPFAQHINAL